MISPHALTDSELQNELDNFTANEPLLQLFRFNRLSTGELRGASRLFAEVALTLVWDTPGNAQRSIALHKLREAKDCAVTAQLWRDPGQEIIDKILKSQYVAGPDQVAGDA